MSGEINPTRINQPGVDTGSEVSADGVPIQQMAAPTSRQQPRPTNRVVVRNNDEPITSMEQLPVTEDSPKAGEINPNANNEQTAEFQEVATTDGEGTTATKPVDFTDFLKAGADEKFVPKEEVKPKEEVVSKEEEETKLTTGDETHQQQKPTLTKQQKIANDKKTRDLTGIADADKPLFINDMSRAAFDKVAPIIKEHPALKQQVTELTQQLEKAKKGGLPDNYYEHPQGFVLSPEYTTAVQRSNLAETIVNHWQQQFAEIRGGSAEYTNIGFDTNGNLIETGKVAAGPDAEASILRAINTTQSQAIKEQAKLEAMQIGHKERYSQTMNWLNQYESQRVGIFDQEQGKQFLPQVQQTLKSFPPTLQSNPLAMSVAKRDVIIFQLGNIIKTLQEQQNKGGATIQQNGTTINKPSTTQQRVQQTRRLAGPTNSDTGADSSTGGNGKSEVTMDAFEAAKNGY